MYPSNMTESLKKVEAAREANAVLEPARMTAEEKENLLSTYHPDYKQDEFDVLKIGPNKGEKVPTELAAILQANSRINPADIDLSKVDYDVDVLVIGGSGSGKTRFFCKPGIMSVNCSYLIVDPKGEMLRSTGYLLKEEGYDIKVFDLIHPRQSDGYNPFTYIRDDPDVLKLMDNLVKNTTPPKGASNDPFWEKAEIALDSALMLYLLYEAPVEEQNFEMLMFMLECVRAPQP